MSHISGPVVRTGCPSPGSLNGPVGQDYVNALDDWHKARDDPPDYADQDDA